MKRNSIILLVAGLIVLSLAQIINHYTHLPDIIKGLFVGTGIGILILAVFKIRKVKSNL